MSQPPVPNIFINYPNVPFSNSNRNCVLRPVVVQPVPTILVPVQNAFYPGVGVSGLQNPGPVSEIKTIPYSTLELTIQQRRLLPKPTVQEKTPGAVSSKSLEEKNVNVPSEAPKRVKSRGRSKKIQGSMNREIKKFDYAQNPEPNAGRRDIPRPVTISFPSSKGMSCSENNRYGAKNAINGDPRTATR